MATEYRRDLSCFVGSRIAVAFNLMRKAFPDLRQWLPAPPSYEPDIFVNVDPP
jgi:hypothetical protein